MQFRVLGPVEVLERGTPVEVGTPRQRSLLARLLVDVNRVVPLDRIIDDLWEGEPPATATATLQSYVSQLRRVLEPGRAPRTPATVLVTRPPGYLLAVAEDDLDAACFAAAVGRGRRLMDAGRPAEAEVAFDEALALWRGVPYADVELDSFAAVERHRLEELRASALEDRFTALLDQGRHRYALGDLEAFTAEHPYRERGWELLVLARYRAGRQVDALRAYQDARKALVEQIGVEPGAALVDLERRVVAQDPDLEWRPAGVVAPSDPSVPLTGGDDGAPPSDGRDAVRSRGDLAAGPDLVGRSGEARLVLDAVARLRGGVGGFVVVAGDPGIGKTHLIASVLGAESVRGVQVGWGRSGDGEGAPSYWPWSQALEVLADGIEPEVLATAGPVVAHVVPALASRLGDPPPLPDDPASARFAVHRAVTELLRELAADRPTVVVLDDVQWADVASLQLLSTLAGHLRDLPLLVVVTLRPAEARANPALVDTLALAARELEVVRIDLSGLGVGAVASYLEATGLDPSHRLVTLLHARTGGNPFFLGELTRLLVSRRTTGGEAELDAARQVPHGVHDVVQQRLARLPDASRDLLGVAAVAGRDIDVVVLAVAADLDPDTVLDRIEPAVVSGMVVLDEEGAFEVSFAHDLVRDAVYDELSAVRRTRLHRRLADALVERHGEGPNAPASSIAFHYSGALALGTGEQALRWARRAADAATTRAADDEAVRAWEQALRALEAVRPEDTAARFDLLVGLASSLRRSWDLDAAREVLDSALEIAVALEDPLRLAEAAALYGGVNLWTWRAVGTVDERTITLLEDALARLPDDAAITRSRALGTLAVELYYGDDRERCVAAADESVRLAESSGGTVELARALNNSFISRWRPDSVPELLGIAERMLALGDLAPDVEAVALMHRAMLLMHLGRVGDLGAVMTRIAELRDEVRMPDVVAQLDLNLATWTGLGGDPDRAEEYVERAWVRYGSSTMWGAEWVYLLGRLALGRGGDIDAVADRLVALASGEAFDLIRPTALVALVEAGRHDEARALAGDGPRLVECWSWLFNVAQWTLVAAELHLPVLPELRRSLERHADLFVVAGSNLAVWGSAHWMLARAAEAEGDRVAADAHWAAADRLDAGFGLGLGPAPRRGLIRTYTLASRTGTPPT